MFVLTEMKDIIQIKPFNFVHDAKETLEFGLNKKFANKVKLQQKNLFTDNIKETAENVIMNSRG